MPPDQQVQFAARLSVAMVAAFVFIILGLAGAHFFRRPPTGQGVALRLHEGASVLFALVHLSVILLGPAPGVTSAVTGVALYAWGLALFLWAQDTIKQQPPHVTFADVDPDRHYVAGPFALVRHPCYVAFTLVWVAGAVATRNPWVLLTAVVMSISYVRAARAEEAAYARTHMARSYQAYMEQTGMFVPRAGTLLEKPWTVSAAVVLAVLAALALAARMLTELLASYRL